MIAWCRADLAQPCGRCGAVIAVGDPVCVIELSGLSRRLRRCQSCLGPAPEELPVATPKAVKAPLPFVRFSADRLPVDVKARRIPEDAA